MESRIVVGKEIAMREEKDDRFAMQVENRAAIEGAKATRDAAAGYAPKQKENGTEGKTRRRICECGERRKRNKENHARCDEVVGKPPA